MQHWVLLPIMQPDHGPDRPHEEKMSMFGLFGKNEKEIEELIANKQYDELPTAVIDDIAQNLILTTEFAMPEYKVTQRLEIITAECVFGMNMFRDMFASIRDIVGGRSSASQKVLRDARKTCLTELRREALIAGADAVIGVDLDYSEISGDGKSMLMVVASGTAVKIQPV
ncbi:YbjQ family protein [Magnetovibrio sp.]|uniref:YbjQ family protein n=1 Tax=Magnetovibrio sp. TaxID=2024836 RepID=UPI0039C93331